MKPQTDAFLEKSLELLDDAKTMAAIELYAHAARTAYLAAFHAAQAILFERSDQVFKTHRGVHGHFAKLARDDPRFSPESQAFLGRAFSFKMRADYETALEASVDAEQARETIQAAAQLVRSIETLLGRV